MDNLAPGEISSAYFPGKHLWRETARILITAPDCPRAPSPTLANALRSYEGSSDWLVISAYLVVNPYIRVIYKYTGTSGSYILISSRWTLSSWNYCWLMINCGCKFSRSRENDAWVMRVTRSQRWNNTLMQNMHSLMSFRNTSVMTYAASNSVYC